MNTTTGLWACVGVAWVALTVGAAAGEAPSVVCNVKVVSDKVEDVSSLEAWQRATLKAGMDDQAKALAIWQSAVKFRHHDVPAPREYLAADANVDDAIKLFNVYGYCTGGPAQQALIQLARQAGLPARHWSIYRWGVPEIFYDKGWHMFDVGMINYFPKPDGSIASVEELFAAVKGWHEQNPGYYDNAEKLKQLFKEKGVEAGPEILGNCPTLQKNGAFTFNYFGWYSSMIVYSGPKAPFVYEEPYSQGYRVNLQLRRGERIIRNFSNQGLHVNMLDEPRKDPETLKAVVGKSPLYYTAALGDLSNNRIGNGTVEYVPPLTEASFAASTIAFENLRVADGALAVNNPEQPAVLVLGMPNSYVYLGGKLDLRGRGDIAVDISDNHGLDWKSLGKIAESVDLRPAVFRRYDYRLRFTLRGPDARLESLRIVNDFQHSQRALPALDQGDNTITFSAGPAESTLTVEPSLSPQSKGKQLVLEDFHPAMASLDEAGRQEYGTLAPAGESGSVTFPITVPGDLKRLRFGCFYRARDKEDGWDLQVSFDEGKTFTTVDRAGGATNGAAKWVSFTEIPANTRRALVRYAGKQKNNLVIFQLRIDADYTPDQAGFAPVRTTYVWEEGGQEKRDQHIAARPNETYTIRCQAKPTMKAIILERAD